jgi:hypothetical protein
MRNLGFVQKEVKEIFENISGDLTTEDTESTEGGVESGAHAESRRRGGEGKQEWKARQGQIAEMPEDSRSEAAPRSVGVPPTSTELGGRDAHPP